MELMDEPQVWTLIGVFAAIMLGVMTLTTTLLTRNITSALQSFASTMDARFDAMDRKFDAIDAKFASMRLQMSHLDRDVQTLMRREFGDNLG